jgi:hypothetical protein
MVPPAITTEFSGDSSLTSVDTRRLMRPSESTTGVKPRPTPNGLNSTFRVTSPSVSRAADGDRELAAGQELGGLARHRGQRRLRQGPDKAVAFHGLDHRIDLVSLSRNLAIHTGPLTRIEPAPLFPCPA